MISSQPVDRASIKAAAKRWRQNTHLGPQVRILWAKGEVPLLWLTRYPALLVYGATIDDRGPVRVARAPIKNK